MVSSLSFLGGFIDEIQNTKTSSNKVIILNWHNMVFPVIHFRDFLCNRFPIFRVFALYAISTDSGFAFVIVTPISFVVTAKIGIPSN